MIKNNKCERKASENNERADVNGIKQIYINTSKENERCANDETSVKDDT